MIKTFLFLAIALGALLSGCGQKDVSFDTLETARTSAKANAEYNALGFRATSPQYANFALEVQGDSTQTPACPQGDGWASAKMVDKTNPSIKVGLKCSTVFGARG